MTGATFDTGLHFTVRGGILGPRTDRPGHLDFSLKRLKFETLVFHHSPFSIFKHCTIHPFSYQLRRDARGVWH